MPDELLKHALRSLWTAKDAAPRRRTLARLAQHERQIEGWWKCELGAHLWEHVEHFGSSTYVWLEALDRADLAIAPGRQSSKGLQIATDGAVCIPIELKTTGTWWGKAESAVDKALSEGGKKRLSADMGDLRKGRRPMRPFGAVGLLVTHLGRASDPTITDYLKQARKLAGHLEVLLDEVIELPVEAGRPTTAHQIFWIARAPV